MLSGSAAARGYLDLGMDAIPLFPLSKRARLLSWQRTDPTLQWESATDADNVGLRGGGPSGLAVLDSDDKKRPTWSNVVDFLWGYGLEPGAYPVIRTPHAGRHVYLSLTETLDGDYRTFAPDFGAGEFRYGPGALVAAPPSELPDGAYQLESGDLRNIPRMRVQDILPILSNQVLTTNKEQRQIPKPSRRALALLQGQGIERYSTRSEAEQAIITSLINSGFDLSEITDFFIAYPAAGKFRELWNTDPRKALRWLKGSYEKALQFVSTNLPVARERVGELLGWARSKPWPGRTGSTDRAVYLAHLAIAMRSAKLVYGASSRELAELSGVSKDTAVVANHRLVSDGLLSLEAPSHSQQANQFRLEYGNQYNLYTECERLSDSPYSTNRDVFRRGGLGKAAGEIYNALLEKPDQTLGELVKKTGRGRMTVYEALKRMSKLADSYTGEYLPMVEKKGEKWRALQVDLEKVAQIVGTAGALRRQKQLHAKERAAHRRGLELSARQEEKKE